MQWRMLKRWLPLLDAKRKRELLGRLLDLLTRLLRQQAIQPTMLPALVILVGLAGGVARSQTLRCATVPEGCDAGPAHQDTLQRAIQRFSTNAVYGGRPDVFASSLSQTGTLAQISYSCSDGSVPPPLLGSTAQALLSRILTCPNRCGGISLAGNSRCGFGALIATNVDAENCFAKAIDLAPERTQPTVKPSAGGFVSRGCRTDSPNARALTGGSAEAADMTVERCVQLAQGFRYAGVEFSRQCFWGNDFVSGSSEASADQCNMACGGSLLDVCGGDRRINIYENTTWTRPPPPPTTVPSVGSFRNHGCFVDLANGARVLRADSSTQAGERGMTVEKCVALGRDAGWRWAGVEFGSQCFVGNTLRGDLSAPASDCSMRCAGNPAETCGGGNRIQVYQDTDWKDPTLDELAGLIRRYHAAMSAARGLLDEAEKLLAGMMASSAKGKRAMKRQSGPLQGLRNRFTPVRIELEEIAMTSTRNVGRYVRLDIDNPGEGLRLNADDYRTWQQQAQEAPRAFRNVETNLDRLLAGELSAAQVVLIVRNALVAYGPILALGSIPVGAAGVFFGIIALIWQKLFPSTGSPEPPPSQTTSSRPPGETPTPVVLLMADGTTQQDYVEVINEIVRRNSIIITKINYEKVELRALTANMTDEAIDAMLANPKVATLSRRIQADPEVNPSDARLAPRQLKPGPRTNDSSPGRSIVHKRGLTLPGRFDRFVEAGPLFEDNDPVSEPLNPPPFHLSWLTSLWAMTGLRQSSNSRYYAFNNYIYDPIPPPIPVRVYVLDTGIRATHQEFANRRFEISYNAMQEDLLVRVDQDNDGHGTCMASCVSGQYSGVFKHADLVPIKIMEKSEIAPWLDHVIRAFAMVEYDMKTARMGVMSMSVGFPLESLKVRDSQPPNRYDPFAELLPRLEGLGLVAVASTGNNAGSGQGLGSHTPRRNGGRDTKLIVIGATDENSVRAHFSNYLDFGGKGILTGYANGVDVVCAGKKEDNQYLSVGGSSPATAQVAGLVALMLARGQWIVPDAKQSLVSEARRLKGDNFPPVATVFNTVSDEDSPPVTRTTTILGNEGLRVALDQLVTCETQASQPQPPIAVQPAYTAPSGVFADVIRTTELKSLPTAAEPTCVFPPPTMARHTPVLGPSS
ncbi:hypothetical protein QBC34DRAFT_411784 [Podospora aff. communis PSN243]|uniref:WSC domain-containing protein n=1 Tax=Podospora aff. communis PSN243 TaxID=3040156 RepID=A0AAV9GDT0_9PEZI|nr:hypothetical protein QBC34DRAFT_411784 [Podospora aff. communis PSN243]